MKKHTKLVFLLIWIALLVGSAVWYLFFAEREASYHEAENRNLAAAPKISFASFWNGELSNGLEQYLLDRFWARDTAIEAAASLKDFGSIATYEDSLAVMQGSKDTLSEDAPDESELEQMVSDLLNNQSTPAPTPEVTVPPSPSPTLTPSPEETPVFSPEPTPEPTPVIEPKPPANEEDFPLYPAIMSVSGGETAVWKSYSRVNAIAVASVLGRVADMLPEGGRLVYTMVPQSYIANNYLWTSDKEYFTSQTEEIVHAFTPDNVTALSSAAILDEHIKAGEYVFFRSDMHWTPEGTYWVYREMAEAAGITPTDWEEFNITVEEPFLGTYYRDNPTSYMADNPDSLTLVSPAFDLEWRRITAKDEYTLIPLLDENARANDRYTVYLGGPAGPWTYAKSDNGKEDNCLVITDSFGLAFVPMIATNYGETHYLDPRYYDHAAVGYTVKEMIEKHNIKDVYVVVGDLHSYSSNFLLTQLSSELGDQ